MAIATGSADPSSDTATRHGRPARQRTARSVLRRRLRHRALTLLVIDIKIPASEGIVTTGESAVLVRDARRDGYFSLVVYSLLAVVAFWFPLAIAIVTTMLWAYRLTFSLRAE